MNTGAAVSAAISGIVIVSADACGFKSGASHCVGAAVLSSE